MNFKEIRSKITSDNQSILNRSISFVDDRLNLLRERTKLAEARATTMMVVGGILAGFLVHFGNTIDKLEIADSILVIALFLAAILLNIKTIYYSIRTLWVVQVYELNADLVFDLQEKSEQDALKEELTGKIWEYWMMIHIPTKKLFWLNRSQRNAVAAIITYSMLGMILFLKTKVDISFSQTISTIAASALGLLIIFIDKAMERYGKLWNT